MTVSTDGGATYGGSGTEFEYVERATVEMVEPSEGPLGGGTRVRVVGRGFRAGADAGCRFGVGEAGTVEGRWVSSSMMLCVSPAAERAGEVGLGIRMEGMEYASVGGAVYRYRAWPTVTGMEPSRGAGGAGAVVRLTVSGGGGGAGSCGCGMCSGRWRAASGARGHGVRGGVCSAG